MKKRTKQEGKILLNLGKIQDHIDSVQSLIDDIYFLLDDEDDNSDEQFETLKEKEYVVYCNVDGEEITVRFPFKSEAEAYAEIHESVTREVLGDKIADDISWKIVEQDRTDIDFYKLYLNGEEN